VHRAQTPSDAFDKVARLLRLPHSPDRGSGAVLEAYASMDPLPPFDSKPGPKFPIPMSTGQHAHQLQFSFSGLLSSVERYILKLQPTTSAEQVGQSTAGSPARSAKTPDPPGNRIQRENAIELSEGARRAISRSFQTAAITHLTQKIALALSLPELQDVQGVVVSGGVASNQALRTE
jgi:tRNA A37 threonylcarbamoyltransferase TsaD